MRKISISFVHNYFKQMYSQKGVISFIKKRLFGNLLNVLIEQENYLAECLAEQENYLAEQKSRLREQEARLDYWERPILRKTPGLLIDVSTVAKSNAGTGIQRVVNNIFREIYIKRKKEDDVIAVGDYFGKLIASNRYVYQLTGEGEKQEYIISLQNKDKLLLLDSSWNRYEDYSNILDLMSENNNRSYAVIYDLLPVQYPELFDSSEFVSVFCSWHDMILQKADSILCISRTTADVVAKYYEKMPVKRNRPLNLFYFHMGADVSNGVQNARREIKNFFNSSKVFLMVGTLEPRKGHMVVLQAFRKVLKDNLLDCRLLIIGHNGWNNDEIREQIYSPEYKNRVLWIEDGSDEELRWAYAHADALIAASKDEGFGLPLVEAAHFGLPILCSDIPIFREVTQDHADYFKVMDADDLAKCIIRWLNSEEHPESGRIHIYTWQESAQEILDIVEGKMKPYRILQ